MQTTTYRFRGFVLSGLITLAVIGPLMAQPGGNGPLKGPFSKTAGERFQELAKGKDYIVINDHPGYIKLGLEKFAKENNITDGKLTLPQYQQYHEAMQKQLKAGFPGGGSGGPPGAGAPGEPPTTKYEGTTVGGDKVHNAHLKAGFEYTIRLKAMEPGWDPFLYLYDPKGILLMQDDDGDGFPNSKIVFTPKEDGKYKLKCSSFGGNSSGKYQLTIEGGPALATPKPVEQPKTPETPKGPPSESKAEIDLEELEQRPNVYTGPKLPPGLPDWFAKLDTDMDGQIGLYEWVAAKKPIEEFKAMDRNGDGFLTPEEVLYYIQTTNPSAVADAPDNSKSDNSKKPFPGPGPGPGKFPGFKWPPTKPGGK